MCLAEDASELTSGDATESGDMEASENEAEQKHKGADIGQNSKPTL